MLLQLYLIPAKLSHTCPSLDSHNLNDTQGICKNSFNIIFHTLPGKSRLKILKKFGILNFEMTLDVKWAGKMPVFSFCADPGSNGFKKIRKENCPGLDIGLERVFYRAEQGIIFCYNPLL